MESKKYNIVYFVSSIKILDYYKLINFKNNICFSKYIMVWLVHF